MSDTCCDCAEILDVTKAVYRAPKGGVRCPICQIIAENRAELRRVAETLKVLAAVEVERGGVN